MTTERLVYSVGEAAEALGASRGTILRLIGDGRLRAVRLGQRSFRIPRAALEDLLAGQPATGHVLHPDQ